MAVEIQIDTLVNIGAVTIADAEAAKDEALREQINPLTVLSRRGLTSADTLARAHAFEAGLPFAEERQLVPVSAEVRDRIPHSLARQLGVIPLGVSEGRLIIAVAAASPELKSALQLALPGIETSLVIASQDALASKVQEYYSASSEAAAVALELGNVEPIDAAPSLESLVAEGAAGEIPRIVHLLINEGVQRGASDIHLEPHGNVFRVRYRVDGELLVDPSSYTLDQARTMIAHIKVISRLDSSERRRPQDGRVPFTHNGQRYDLRVVTLPVAAEGEIEKVVLRILASSLAGKPLHELDFSPENLKMFRAALRRHEGMVLVTGPTGSGKSTTLYSGINEIATDDKNVLTVEDPVEYRFPGLNQVPIRPNIDLSFPDILRAFLRADPDVILVGEIRDLETANIAIKASLTGHLVLSTLHTNSAALTVSRLSEMGIDRYLIADSLSAVLSQRLVKRLCPHCRVAYVPTPQELAALGVDPAAVPPGTVAYQASPSGCRQCYLGHKGRIPLHELLPVTTSIKDAILSGASAADLEKIAVKSGKMHTLAQDGWRKVTEGKTDLAQVLSLIASDADFE